MALTIFLIFTIVWLFWQNTKLYRTTQILLKEIKKRGKIIEEDIIALENGTRTVKELTAKYKKLAQNHNDYVRAKREGRDDSDIMEIEMSDN